MSFWSVPLVTVGLGLSAFMVGAEGFGGRAVAESADVQAFFEALEIWGVATYLSTNLLLTLGLVGWAVAVAKSKVLGRAATWLVVGGAVIQAAGLFSAYRTGSAPGHRRGVAVRMADRLSALVPSQRHGR